MTSLTLVVLAAGLGSRFGGVKQLTAVDEAGQTLVDYSVFDALRAGFDKVVCVVTPELEAAFHAQVGRRIARQVDLVYAHQTIDALPPGYRVPAGRVKPWGTGHAVCVALPLVDGPFATVNADDFYGADAFRQMAGFLKEDSPDHGLVGYHLSNTLSANGTVSRGVCRVGGDGRLQAITERTALRAAPGGAVDEAGQFLDGDSVVSLNFWGFRPSAAPAFPAGLRAFLDQAPALADEYYLPDVAASLIPQVRVLPTSATWLGVTYADDLPKVRRQLAESVAQGVYPPQLWP